MNDISVKQNEPSLLKYQFGARYCYDRADSLNKLIFSLLVSMLLLDILFYYFNLNILLQLIITIIIVLSQFLANIYISKYLQMGLYYKSKFDYSLFEMELPTFNKKLIYEEYLINLEKVNKKKFITQISNNGEDIPPGVKDWYSLDDNTKTLGEATLYCMKENFNYSEKISKVSLITLIFTLSIAIFIGTIFLHINHTLFIIFFIQFASVLYQLGLLLFNEIKYLLILYKIKCCIEFNIVLNASQLLLIQEYTDEYRSINRITSKNFHMKNSKRIHETYKELKKRGVYH